MISESLAVSDFIHRLNEVANQRMHVIDRYYLANNLCTSPSLLILLTNDSLIINASK